MDEKNAGKAPPSLPSLPDEHEETYESRVRIGFVTDRQEWATALAQKSPSTLSIESHPVMEDWETGYMEMLAAFAASKGGRILEVGFGLGLSARAIQKYPIEEHVIIEANADVYKDACIFAAQAPQRTIALLGFWQDVTPTLPDGSFDGILFDTYPLSAEEVHRNHFPFFPEAFRLLKEGGVFTYYSDEVSGFSAEHRLFLERAGFRAIDSVLCPVEPGENCLYWKHKTILVPRIRKDVRGETETPPYGLQLLFDGYGAPRTLLEDVGFLYDTLMRLPEEIGMRRLGYPQIIQIPETPIVGLSGFVFIIESHISVHTYSERGFVTLDIYSCKEFDTEKAKVLLESLFKVRRSETQVIVRGTKFHADFPVPPVSTGENTCPPS